MEDDSHPLSSRWAFSYLFTWVEILLQRSNALLPRALLLLLVVALLLLLLRRNALPRIDRPHRVTKPIGTTTHKLAPSRLQNSEPKPIKTTNTGSCYKPLQKMHQRKRVAVNSDPVQSCYIFETKLNLLLLSFHTYCKTLLPKKKHLLLICLNDSSSAACKMQLINLLRQIGW